MITAEDRRRLQQILSAKRAGKPCADCHKPGAPPCTGCAEKAKARALALAKAVARPVHPAPSVRHLLYHVYPVSDNGMWQWNVDELVKRLDLFNGRKVVAVAVDRGKRPRDPQGPNRPDRLRQIPGCDSFASVVDRFGRHAGGIEFVEVENDPKLREVASFLPLFERLSSNVSPDECLLYAQAKGVTRPAGHVARRWAEVLYEVMLDYWPVVADSLTRYPVTGAFRKAGRGWSRDQSESDWHYSGSWFWCRNQSLFTSPDWRKIDQFWSGIEPYPSQHFGRDSRGVGCLFHEGTVRAMNLYDHRYWGRHVEPDLARFRAANGGKKTVTPSILDFIRRTRTELSLPPPGRVLEVGSRDVNGTPRGEFADAAEYVGVDAEAGPGVDMVCDGEGLADVLPPESFDSVVCCETLEHCVRPWRIVEGMRKLLKPGGLLWVTTPTFGFPEHRHPIDCYRFGEDAYRGWLFEGMEILRMETITDDAGNPVIVAVGKKPLSPVARPAEGTV